MGNKKSTEQKTVATPELSPQMKGVLYGAGRGAGMNMQGQNLGPVPPLGAAAFPPGQNPMATAPAPGGASGSGIGTAMGGAGGFMGGGGVGGAMGGSLPPGQNAMATAPGAGMGAAMGGGLHGGAGMPIQDVAAAFKGQNTGHHTGAISGLAKGALGPGGSKGKVGK